jgi:hypothetical protein
MSSLNAASESSGFTSLLLSGLGLKGFVFRAGYSSFFGFLDLITILGVGSFVSFGFLSLCSFFWRLRIHFRNPNALVFEFMP